MLGTILAGSLGALGLGASIYNMSKQHKLSEQNFNLQKDNIEYQKALQQQLFEREDTSYQRTREDMLSAGFSPLAMQGLNSSGSTVSTSAPQQSLDISQSLSTILGVASQAQSLSQVQSGIAKNDAETRYINAQAENQEIKNLYSRDNEYLNNMILREDYSRKNRENFTDNVFGVTSNMPDTIKSLLYSCLGFVPTRKFQQTSVTEDGGLQTDFQGYSPTTDNDSFSLRDVETLKKFDITQNINFWTSLLKGFM